MTLDALRLSPLSHLIWEQRYRDESDSAIEDTWMRVARAVAAAEPADSAVWTRRFYDLLSSMTFLPGGRILAGAGTACRVTLFVLAEPRDALEDLEGVTEADLARSTEDVE